MTDEDRSLVRVARDGKGNRSWSVSVRVGDTAEQLAAAVRVAQKIEQLLGGDAAGDPRPVREPESAIG